jgi:hypothetical protein
MGFPNGSFLVLQKSPILVFILPPMIAGYFPYPDVVGHSSNRSHTHCGEALPLPCYESGDSEKGGANWIRYFGKQGEKGVYCLRIRYGNLSIFQQGVEGNRSIQERG